MTLSGGLGARTWNKKQLPGGKSWPPEISRAEYRGMLRINKFFREQIFIGTLLEGKHYGAEYYTED